MSYAAPSGKCVNCGKTIYHRIVPTGRTFPAGCEISDGIFYKYLNGELCRECDVKIPIEDKDPAMASVFERFRKMK